MANENFEDLITKLIVSPTDDILGQISEIFERMEDLDAFVSKEFHSVIHLENWAWEILSRDTRLWYDEEQGYVELFTELGLFNHRLIISTIEMTVKQSILLPQAEEMIEKILEQIERRTDENDRFLPIVIQWIDQLALFAHEHAEITTMNVMIHLNERLFSEIFMQEQFRIYLGQLKDSSHPISIKQQFYLKTSLFSLSEYFHSKPDNYLYNGQQVLEYFNDDYINLILIHSLTVSSWPSELLGCLTHLIGIVTACYWWIGIDHRMLQTLIKPNQRFYNYLHSLIDIFNCLAIDDEQQRILVENLLELFRYLIHFQDIKYRCLQEKKFLEVLLRLNQTKNDRILFLTYRLQSELYSEKRLKELHLPGHIHEIFFHYLEKAYQNPAKIHRKISIEEILKSFFNLSSNDIFKDVNIDENELTFLLELADQYPIIYSILWALSFDICIQEQLRLDPNFVQKLNKPWKNVHMQRIIHGIQWNLNLHDVQQKTKITDEKKFDVMLSYSQKDKLISTQIATELTSNGFRVCMDFNDGQENFIDSILQIVDQSRFIVVCISERYKRSSVCRITAQYAFKRRSKFLPILIDKNYKPDGWLSFLLGSADCIDFVEKEHCEAMRLLMNGMKNPTISVIDALVVRQQPQNIANVSLPKLRSTDVRQWTTEDVQEWLNDNHLSHLGQILTNLNGLELVRFGESMSKNSLQENFKLFQEDAIKQTGKSVSLIEISRLRHLIDEQVHMPVKKKKWSPKNCCRMM